ncbi:MAG: TfoX/Sxy family protein [Clostridia bacterium]
MATTKEYLQFILDQCAGLEDIAYRAMMGEYILYYRGKIAAYLCDDRLLVKAVAAAKKLLPEAPLEPPYEGAKEMILVEDIDNADFLRELFRRIYDELPEPKKKRTQKVCSESASKV